MLRRQAFASVLLAVAAAAGCGSSDDSAGNESEDDTAQGAEQDTGADADQGTGDDGSTGDADSGDEQTDGPADATPPVVGTFVEGRAVATVSGTPNEPDEQSGDVKRIDQNCFGAESMSGLEAGASVTILDGSSGEAIGAGEVESTSATEISDGSDGSPPVWECSFHIAASISRTAESIQVQVGDLEPWDVQGSFDDFVTSVPSSGGSSVDTTPTESTEPSVGTTPSAGTTPPTEPFVTSPST